MKKIAIIFLVLLAAAVAVQALNLSEEPPASERGPLPVVVEQGKTISLEGIARTSDLEGFAKTADMDKLKAEIKTLWIAVISLSVFIFILFIILVILILKKRQLYPVPSVTHVNFEKKV